MVNEKELLEIIQKERCRLGHASTGASSNEDANYLLGCDDALRNLARQIERMPKITFWVGPEEPEKEKIIEELKCMLKKAKKENEKLSDLLADREEEARHYRKKYRDLNSEMMGIVDTEMEYREYRRLAILQKGAKP